MGIWEDEESGFVGGTEASGFRASRQACRHANVFVCIRMLMCIDMSRGA